MRLRRSRRREPSPFVPSFTKKDVPRGPDRDNIPGPEWKAIMTGLPWRMSRVVTPRVPRPGASHCEHPALSPDLYGMPSS